METTEWLLSSVNKVGFITMKMLPSILEQAIRLRRQLHSMPELSGQELRTAGHICGRLAEMGIAFERNIGGHGVVAMIRKGKNPRSVGLRCELDALPILECADIPHVSQNPGVMHACGHDGHMAAVLGAAALLQYSDEWEGTIRLIFQPAEETGSGARAMIEDGILERFPCDRIFAFHNYPGLDLGAIAVHDGPVMAAGNQLAITVQGASSHAAMPHLARDPVIAAGHLLVALQTIVSREIAPGLAATLSLTTLKGGTVANQIPDRIDIGGTLRTFSQTERQAALDAVRRHCAGLATAFNVDIRLSESVTSNPVINTPRERDLARRSALETGASLSNGMRPSMIGDDFAEFLAHMPGAYVWIGNGPAGDTGALHQERYDFDDRILATAIPWLARTAILSLDDTCFLDDAPC